VLRGGFERIDDTLTGGDGSKFFMHPLSLQSGDWDTLNQARKAFTRLPQLLKYLLSWLLEASAQKMEGFI
jgi:hypothetical protein